MRSARVAVLTPTTQPPSISRAAASSTAISDAGASTAAPWRSATGRNAQAVKGSDGSTVPAVSDATTTAGTLCGAYDSACSATTEGKRFYRRRNSSGGNRPACIVKYYDDGLMMKSQFDAQWISLRDSQERSSIPYLACLKSYTAAVSVVSYPTQNCGVRFWREVSGTGSPSRAQTSVTWAMKAESLSGWSTTPWMSCFRSTGGANTRALGVCSRSKRLAQKSPSPSSSTGGGNATARASRSKLK